MKTKEELNALKEEVETVNRKLRELTDEELNQITGGISNEICIYGREFTVNCPHNCPEMQAKWGTGDSKRLIICMDLNKKLLI